MGSGCTLVRERVDWRKWSSVCKLQSIKIAAIAGRNLKYSDCEQIEGFSDTQLHIMLAVKIVWSFLSFKLLKIHICRLSYDEVVFYLASFVYSHKLVIWLIALQLCGLCILHLVVLNCASPWSPHVYMHTCVLIAGDYLTMVSETIGEKRIVLPVLIPSLVSRAIIFYKNLIIFTIKNYEVHSLC